MKNPLGKHIARQISAWFLLLAIAPMSIGAVVSHVNTRNSIIRELGHHLRDIIRERIKRLELYVTQQRDNVVSLAAAPAVIRALENCERHFCATGMEPERLAAFRLGGEEFGAIITQHRVGEAAAIAERLLNAVEKLRIPHEKNTAGPYVTVSCGVISLRMDKHSELSLEDFYRRADSALYRAKQAGRNRVEIHPGSI